VTPGVFELLGVRPIHGRIFTPPASTALPEVMLSEAIWAAAFGRDPAVLGKRVRVGGVPAVVVGIMPEDFRFPEPVTQAWASFTPVAGTAGGGTIVGRLRVGVPLPDAESRTAEIARRVGYIPRNYRSGTGAPPFTRVGDRPLGEFVTRALWVLFAGVALVFVVLCANVNSVLLARLGSRRRDFGVCAALGAARARLIRQAMIEHVVIGMAGAGAGLGLAWLLTSLVPEAFLGRTLNPIDIDPRALAAASSIGVISVLLSGFLPAWLGTRADPMATLKRSGQSATGTAPSRTPGSVLVAVEIALACSLLVGSAFLVQSFVNLVRADRGFNTDGVTHVRLDLDSIGELPATPPAPNRRESLLRQVQAARGGVLGAIESAFAAAPGVHAVALSQELPPDTGGGRGNVRRAEHEDPIQSDGYRVGPSFFDLYGIRILKGRAFQPGDTDTDVVIGERLAELLWPGEDPIGRPVVIGRDRGRRVIGVASEIRLPTLEASLDRPEFYTPIERHADDVYVSLRCDPSCPDEPAIRSLAAAVHPSLGVRILASRENRYLEHLRLPRATAQVGGLFAVVAVVTAAGGLFSLLTYAVGRRRREFGIRTALGASPGQMARLVIRDGLAVAATGIGVGTIGGWFVVKSLAAFQYGVTSRDPVIWTGVVVTIAIVSLAAAWRPALEAMRVDPVRLLREE
jgi:predicted permease